MVRSQRPDLELESGVNQRHKLMRAEMSTKVAGVEESVAKVEGKVDALDAKLCASWRS